MQPCRRDDISHHYFCDHYLLLLLLFMRRAVAVKLRQAAQHARMASSDAAASCSSSQQDHEASPRPELSPLAHPHCARRRALDEMLRVDHAGETAAVQIYEGQRAVLGRTAEGPVLAQMAQHEAEHLRRFQQLVRPCARSLRRRLAG
jgi:demethoxyubiquinone hydroxylase (CLK1/Coq7/Cat5 family)